mgnify:CR=1 FL=1
MARYSFAEGLRLARVLRVYAPWELDTQWHVPDGFYDCHACAPGGPYAPGTVHELADGELGPFCPNCAGYRSIYAAAIERRQADAAYRDPLWERLKPRDLDAPLPDGDQDGDAKLAAIHTRMEAIVRTSDLMDAEPVRCEGCGHPESEGRWVGPNANVVGLEVGKVPPHALHAMFARFVREDHLPRADRYDVDFWSGCDAGCRHLPDPGTVVKPQPVEEGGPRPVEATWRQPRLVLVNGHAHDLRPENLRIMCARCVAREEHLPHVA